ncbi:xanthine phosphoribosyltransferase [Sporolactobacillus sp. CPB3-1]|uniref:Xanthine phosphoribosyltransferase n=1 Tax=Sporolactobacillus mangiferae TaxID=2940498 RepID=A0ABT0MAN9_9BACL|nr:xanthine phosphoribosyltransferase [Sporolactobacillus mangiferae]MCL1631733.1 xanthine phosphoribosyltransferase [Sporolactobacillus mangiferae]
MDELKKRIREEGIVIDSDILKVDQFLNHQIDPVLMQHVGEAFAEAFVQSSITKVLTIESSGIAPALMTGLKLGVPVLFARKKKPLTLNTSILTTQVYSYTKKVHNSIFLEKAMINSEDRVLIIDDFLANGEAAMGLVRLIEMAGASVEGIGIVIEKSFQEGRSKLDRAGYAVYSLARISSLADHQVTFIDND